MTVGGKDGENTLRERGWGWTSDKDTYEVLGGEGSREGPATGSEAVTGRTALGASGAAGLFRDGRLVTTGAARAAGEGAASTFVGGSGTSSGKTVTPTGGDGGGIDGRMILSVFDDLIVNQCLG